jgi:leucyl aminopeptidase (aminopeptidase T)
LLWEVRKVTSWRWGEFGEIAVRMMAQVKPGENLLILADTWTDMEIAEACLIAGINAKANAQLLVIPRMPHTDTREFNASTAGAIQGADVIVGVCGETMFIEKAATRKAREKGTRVVATSPIGQEDFLIEGILNVDYALMIKTGEKICELWEQTEVCHVTSQLGTDISFQLKGRPARVDDGMATEPGEVDFFPGVGCSIAPIEETVTGTIVIDGNMSPIGLVRTPVTCRLEKGIITTIEGGASASDWRSRLEATGDPKAFHLCHLSLGLNPRARVSGNMHQDEQVLGAITFGFGNQDPSFKGAVGAAKVHTDVVLLSPAVTLDGVLLLERNRLNTELGLG